MLAWSKMLLDAGSNVEVPTRGPRPLMLAARAGSLDVAELLVRHGANVNAREKWRGQTALIVGGGRTLSRADAVLIGHKADVNARAAGQRLAEPDDRRAAQTSTAPRRSDTAVYAARSGCTDCVQALLDAGADPQPAEPRRVTPLMVAIDNFAFDTAKLLFEREANPHVWIGGAHRAVTPRSNMNTYSLDAYAERTGPPIVTTKTTALELARLFLAQASTRTLS